MALDSEEVLSAIFEHLVLPPRITEFLDEDDHRVKSSLGRRLQGACASLRVAFSRDEVWATLQRTIEIAIKLNQGFLSKNTIYAHLQELCQQPQSGSRSWVVLHLETQNAALLIYRSELTSEPTVVFEAFEVSPPSGTILSAEHTLTRDFPDRAVEIPLREMNNESFMMSLATFLEGASSESFEQFSARSKKAGKAVVENRDPAHPVLIIDMLLSLLEAVGTAVNVPRTRKRTRDDTILSGPGAPWRRIPYWLVLQVSCQRVLHFFDKDGNGASRLRYKLLIGVVLSNLLAEATGKLHPEKTLMIHKKLCRRLAKLETERYNCAGERRSTYDRFFTETGEVFESIVAVAKVQVAEAWEKYKKLSIRGIPRLPERVSDDDTRLTLANSGTFLKDLLHTRSQDEHPIASDELPSFNESTIGQVGSLADRYCSLAAYLEDSKPTFQRDKNDSPPGRCEERCIASAEKLLSCMEKANDAFHGDAILMSRYLLRLFELWVAMDRAAIEACPTLHKYHPLFVPEVLDCLCLFTDDEMTRLLSVQSYLTDRIRNHEFKGQHIFADPKGAIAFPTILCSSRGTHPQLRAFGKKIDEFSDRQKEQKLALLNGLTKTYERYTQSIQDQVCCCIVEPDKPVDVRGCRRCYEWRCRKKLKIFIHEDCLPSHQAHRDAILLELQIPQYLDAYRSATWRLHILGICDKTEKGERPLLMLEDFVNLDEFWSNAPGRYGMLTLASEKKSFSQTHYKQMKLPKQPHEVILPFGPSLRYYDQVSKLWVDNFTSKPDYRHLLGNVLPKGFPDPYSNNAPSTNDETHRPSSYEIIANSLVCPSDMSPHEFGAMQRLVSSRGRRWLAILVELASNNLNFSSENAMVLMNHMILQAGPAVYETGYLREAHTVLSDPLFCENLHEQLQKRLDGIATNWREVHCMSILVTISLRGYFISPITCKKRFEDLLSRIRDITSQWITHLRRTMRCADNAEVAKKCAEYALWATLLCRQTYSVYSHTCTMHPQIGRSGVVQFFGASIALQENLLTSLDELSQIVRTMLIRDLIMAHDMRYNIAKWLRYDRTTLEEAINETWISSGMAGVREYSPWQPVAEASDLAWIISKINGGKKTRLQVVHYHLLHGHLLIDGKPFSKLPLKMREDEGLKEIFENRHLLTCPSNLAGMQYQLVTQVMGHAIHFGIRQERVIIQAVVNGYLYEYVPRDVFKGEGTWGPVFDLPADLLDECVHWLNLDTGELEMRRKPDIWKQKESNWTLDVTQGFASRHKKDPRGHRSAKKGSRLVNPTSGTGQKIMRIFRDFEDAHRITIFQPMSDHGRLSVEMKRLELRFFVNRRNGLESSQLGVEIAPNQDIGTLYGLKSYLVCRDRLNLNRLSVLVPDGQFSWKCTGMHVAVRIRNTGTYARFTVDRLLGRLTCPPDARLLYLKAALHAFTSFPIYDPLTQRTGTEEALDCLSAARSQPWEPLQDAPKRLLELLRSLTPSREYYPPGVGTYQKVTWHEGLTMTIQHEAFDVLARRLLRQSQELEAFHRETITTTDKRDLESTQICPLNLRGLIRRLIYERHSSVALPEAVKSAHKTRMYSAVDVCEHLGRKHNRVFKVAKVLHGVAQDHINLKPLLQELEGKDLGGFDAPPATLDVPGLLNSELYMSLGTYIQACLQSKSPHHYSLMFIMSVLATRDDVSDALLTFLSTVANSARVKAIEIPGYPIFKSFQYGEVLDKSLLERLILSSQSTDDGRVNMHQGGSVSDYQAAQIGEASQMADSIISVWPSLPNYKSMDGKIYHILSGIIDTSTITHMDLARAYVSLHPALQRSYCNSRLTDYLVQVGSLVDELRAEECALSSDWRSRVFHASEQYLYDHSISRYSNPQLVDVVTSKVPPESCISSSSAGTLEPQRLNPEESSTADTRTSGPKKLSKGSAVLKLIAENLVKSDQTLRSEYGKDLEKSINALTRDRAVASTGTQYTLDLDDINSRFTDKSFAMGDRYFGISRQIASGEGAYRWLHYGYLWPCISFCSLLSLLRREERKGLHHAMKLALVGLALDVTELQRLNRIAHAILHSRGKPLNDEQMHEGHKNWSPVDFPDWLLLEVDNDLLIREPQIEVAKAIISPRSRSNSVLQMNMGQGKTSCVIPMAIAMLADQDRLCRIIVPKALLLQTAQIIQGRLGGLVGRTIRHIPFSRRSPCSWKDLCIFEDMHKETMLMGGVVICLPEHMLSFKMSGFQKLIDGQVENAKKMIQIQKWFNEKCRDVMDESDFILSPKTQLIYPSGEAQAIDGHPERWRVIEELLSLVQGHLSTLQSRFPGRVEVIWRQKSFPIIHLVDAAVENALNELLVDDICQSRLCRFRLTDSAPKRIKKGLRAIVNGAHVSASTWQDVKLYTRDDVFGTKLLYLLRGLISQRIILLCLSKLWNVHFGLHPERPPIAVPFEAKGVPSATAEYGHPDTAIILTYLAFYQTGLAKAHMTQCLQHIMISDDPATRWEQILGGCGVPPAFQRWSLINLDDGAQMEDLWSWIRFDKNVLNYYVENFVFPRHAKQFEVKLQSSGWDIPLDDSGSSSAITTGFSGTNDNKRLLPETIQQDDLPSLLKTNAEVLGHLLEPRNNRCFKAVDKHGKYLTETGLLGLLCEQDIKVLIDSGSYILEMENHDVAAAWLKMDIKAEGAVYFDRDSRIMVRARFQKSAIPLHSSSFADNLAACVVYIDQRHTRGTDLRLPSSAVGAVTLGLGQTKDQTVQAAMRLRQLSSTQSLAFVAPPEVYRSILDLRPRTKSQQQKRHPVASADVVRWLIEQSCLANENAIGLRVAQGIDYCQRMDALHTYSNYGDYPKSTAKVLARIQNKEDQSLEALYGPRSTAASDQEPAAAFQSSEPRLRKYLDKLTTQRRQMEVEGHGCPHPMALQEVEQHREVELEVEEERQSQKPFYSVPLTYPGLDNFLVIFSRTGVLARDGPFTHAFDFLGTTTIGSSFGISSTGSKLYVSEEFTKTVAKAGAKKTPGKVSKNAVKRAAKRARQGGGLNNTEMRPVEWVLWCPDEEIAIIVIPEEAEQLITILRREESPLVWLINYAPPVTKAMQPLSSSPYCFVPPRATNDPLPTWLSVELNVFAGGLHFRYEEYKPLLSWLGAEELDSPGGSCTGGGDAVGISSAKVQCKLTTEQPHKFLLEWLTYRRQTEEILYTPMGFVCQRKPLQPDHQFFAVRTAAEAEEGGGGVLNNLAPGRTQTENGDEDEDEDSDWGVDEDDVDGAEH